MIIGIPRLWRLRGHRIPEYQEASCQHDEKQRRGKDLFNSCTPSC